MPALSHSGFSLGPERRGLLGASLLVVVLASLAGGWWLGRRIGDGPASEPSRQALEQQVQTLQQRLDLGQADDRDRQRLLEALVGLNRREQASRLLEQMADQQPERWRLRLLLAQLRHDLGDRAGAEREVRQVLNVLPSQIEALQLATRLKLDTGRGVEAAQVLRALYARQTKPRVLPEALPVGLLLADLERQLGQTGQAETTCKAMISDFPRDPRPLLALALIEQDKGRTEVAQALLEQARSRTGTASQASLDRVAAAWGLGSLRRQSRPAELPASSGAVERGLPLRVSPGSPAAAPPAPVASGSDQPPARP